MTTKLENLNMSARNKMVRLESWCAQKERKNEQNVMKTEEKLGLKQETYPESLKLNVSEPNADRFEQKFFTDTDLRLMG